nr:unnamed protein product [Digitaria exilis]
MDATVAPPATRPGRSPHANTAPAAGRGPRPRPWGPAASGRGHAVRCKLSRRPEPRLVLRAAADAAAQQGGGGEAAWAGRRKRLAVFVSGGGSNFRAIHEAALGGEVHGDVVVLVTDKPGCGGAEHARSNGIPVVVFPKSKNAPEGVSEHQVYVEAVAALCEDRILWREDGVPLIQSRLNPDVYL